MYSFFESLKCILKQQTIIIDNYVFRLHYKLTLMILIVFSLTVTLRQFFGDPIRCISGKEVPENVLETFCWTHATFSSEDAWNLQVGVEVPYPGVANNVRGKHTKVYHAYYQWVCFVLFLQAVLFYVPRYFWKSVEKGRIKTMVQDLNASIIEHGKMDASVRALVKYMVDNLNNNQKFAALFFVSEVFNIINVIGQIYLMDKFLGGTFSSYGLQVIKFSEWEAGLRYDPMIRVFPRLTKCTFHNYGSSGDVQRQDALCVLPLNIMNEKIYLFLWFWFILLAVLSCLAIVYRVIIFLSHAARVWRLKLMVNLVKQKQIEAIVRNCNVGDWFIVYLLSKNMSSLSCKCFMDEFARQLDCKIDDYYKN